MESFSSSIKPAQPHLWARSSSDGTEPRSSMLTSDVQRSIQIALRQELPVLVESFQAMLNHELGKHFGALISRVETECSSSSPADISCGPVGIPCKETPAKALRMMRREAKPMKGSACLAAVLRHNVSSTTHEPGQSERDAKLAHMDVLDVDAPRSDFSGSISDRVQRDGDANVSRVTQGLNLARSIPTSNVEHDTRESLKVDTSNGGVVHYDKIQSLFEKLEAQISSLEQRIRSSKGPETTSEEDFFTALGFQPKSPRASSASSDRPNIQNLFPGPLPRNADLFTLVTTSALTPEEHTHALSKVLRCFEGGSIVVTLLSAVLTGYAEDAKLQAAIAGNDEPAWIWTMHLGLAIFFSLELIARLCFICRGVMPAKGDKVWNAFDVIIVLSSWVDLISNRGAMCVLRLVRILRSLLVFRLLRCARRLRHVRVMIEMLKESLVTFMMAFVFFGSCTYIVSIIILQGVTQRIMESGDDQVDNAWRQTINKYCSSLADLLASLTCVLNGGIDLVDLVGALSVVDVSYAVVLILYIPFIVFGLMNIVTSLFVLASHETAQRDFRREIKGRFGHHRSSAYALRSLLREDAAVTGEPLTREGLKAALQKPSLLSCLASMRADANDLLGAYDLLDVNWEGQVEVDELVLSVLRMQGFPQTADIMTLIHGQDRLRARIDVFMGSVAKALHMVSIDRRKEASSSPWPGNMTETNHVMALAQSLSGTSSR